MPSIYVDNKGDLPERREHDLYRTENALIRAVLHHTFDRSYADIRSGKKPKFARITILDPGAGDGRWGRWAREYFEPYYDEIYVVGVELRPDEPPHPAYNEWHTCDYLTWQDERKFDLVLGNPPFSLSESFIRLSYARLHDFNSLLFLLPLEFLCGDDRYNALHAEMPFYKVYAIALRPSFSEDGGTGGTNYAAFHWRPKLGQTHWAQVELMTYQKSDEDKDPEKVAVRREKQREARRRAKLKQLAKEGRHVSKQLEGAGGVPGGGIPGELVAEPA